jgi:hypothetical protein
VAFWAAAAILGRRLMKIQEAHSGFSPPVRRKLLAAQKSIPFIGQDQLALKGNSPSAGLANPLNTPSVPMNMQFSHPEKSAIANFD